MAESAILSTVKLLGKLLVEQIGYLGDVRDQVEGLKDELNSLAAYAVDAAKTQCQDEVVRVALSDARDVAYDCEDVIEKYIHEVARHGYEDFGFGQMGYAMRWVCLGVNAVPALGIHSKIVELNKRISALKSRMTTYGVSSRISAAENNPARHLTTALRRVHTHNREEVVVVGFENQLDELVELLLNPTHKTVISICGTGGIGKSTMARELYHHPKLRDGFKAFGWAVASQRLQPDQLLRNLIYSLVPENDYQRRRKIDDAIMVDRAHGALYDLMSEFKCLVVIDDIWTSNDWARLQDAFPRKKSTKGSMLILTTRNEETVSGMDPTLVHLHPMKALDDRKSWELFQMKAFPGATCADSMKVELGRTMLQHCKGVPLAIVVLAEVLKGKKSVNDWKQIRNDISKQIRRGGPPSLYKEVYDVLQVSYDELPCHLKHCFLHMAFISEGSWFPTINLYQLWAAEGIILKEDPNELEEDIAERYLNELVSRNMVQVSNSEWTPRGLISQLCGLHDLMRDVCTEIAKKEGFLQRIDNGHKSMIFTNDKKENRHLMNLLPERDEKLRRLAVFMRGQEPKSSVLPPISTSANISRAPNLRSLYFVLHERGDVEDCKRLMETIFEDYPLLRVFICQLIHMKGVLPKKVEKLIHLRYLSLYGTQITELPSSIAKLQLLQTLDLRVDTGVVISIPNILWKMKQLRHVYFPYGEGLVNPAEEERTASAPRRYSIKGGGVLRIDGLVNLQTLVNIDLDRVDLKGLSNLERLKTLHAACETNWRALQLLLPLGQHSSTEHFKIWLHTEIINEDPMILSSCEAIHVLYIYAKPNANFHLKQALRLEMLPQSLVELGIWYIQLDDDPLPVLEKLPNLAILRLIKCYGGWKMVCSNRAFPVLNTLSFDGLPRFSHWEVEQGALPKLKYLLLLDCPLREIPDALPSSVAVYTRGNS